MNKLNRILILAIAVLSVACIKNKGNYDYGVVPDVRFIVNTHNDLVAGEELVLGFEYNDDRQPGYTSEFAYEWSVENEILSTEETLTYTSMVLGTKKGLFIATDIKTGAKYNYGFNIYINPLYDSGFLVLSKVGSNSELHYIKQEEVRPEDEEQKRYFIYPNEYMNVYSTANGSPIEGTPVSLKEYYAKDDYNTIYGQISVITEVTGKNTIIDINGQSLTKELNLEQEFASTPSASFNPQEVVHTTWESFIRDENGKIYPKRWSDCNAYNTGKFSEDVSLWGSSSFERIFDMRYPEIQATIILENEDGKRNFKAVHTGDYSDSYNSRELGVTNSGNPEFVADMHDVKYEILASDFIGTDGLIFIRKEEDNSVNVAYKLFEEIGRREENIVVGDSKVFPLEASVGEIVDFKALKNMSTYAYIADKSNIYSYSVEDGKTKLVKNFSGKEIVAIELQSYDNYNYYYYNYEVQMAVAFNDGSVEIYQFASDDLTVFNDEPVFTSSENYGDIVDITLKMGDTSKFFDYRY